MERRTIIRTSTGVGVFLVVVLLGGIAFLKTSMFRRYLLGKVEQQAAESLGGHVQIGSLDLDLLPLVVRLRNVVVRGTEPANDAPLAQVDELTVGISLRSLLHRKVNLGELLIRHPVVYVRVSAGGTNNFPQTPASQSHTTVFDLAIAHFALREGEIVYNDRTVPLYATLDHVESEVAFYAKDKAYGGFVSYANGQLAYAQYSALPHNARFQFKATPSAILIESANLSAGTSEFSFRGEVNTLNHPTVVADYDIRLHPQDFAAFMAGAKTEGNIHLSGTAHYAEVDGQPFLRSVAIRGRLDGDHISAALQRRKVEARAIQAEYELANGELRADDVLIDALGGRISAVGEIRNLDTIPDSHIRADLHNISLRDVQGSLGAAARVPGVTIAGTLAGSADANWEGSVQNIRAHSDLTVNGGARNLHRNSTTMPLSAVIHANYDGPGGVLAIHQSRVQTESILLTADGEVSKNSSLKIHGQVNDLQQLLQIASGFSSSVAAVPAISGSATLDTTVNGSLQGPKFSGQVNAVNLHTQGTQWKTASASFTASPSAVSVINGSLVNARQGRASFAATIQLHNWTYDANNPIRGELSAQKIALADIQHIANVQYPMSGDVSAHISLSGTQVNPSGSGSLEIDNAHAYGELVQAFTLRFNAVDGAINSNLKVATNAGSATAMLTYAPAARSYKVRFDAPEISLQEIQALQSGQELKATASVSANGEGTLDHPQLAATVHVAKLEVQQKSLGDLNATLQVVDKIASLNFDSQLSQSPIRGHAQIQLVGDLQTEASIDTSPIPLDALWATFSSPAPEGFQGQTELHATLKGPLKDKSRIEAHIRVPTLNASYQQLQIGVTQPIRADYVNSVLTVQPAEISGTDSTLLVQGSIPFSGSATPSLSAKGQINVQILRIFQPDLRSSGAIAIDLHATGSPTNPSVQGQIHLQNIAMATSAAPLGVEKLNGLLSLDSNRVQLSDVTAQVGSGQISVGGAVTYRPNVQFALAMQGKSIRLRYPQGLRSVLDGNVSFSGNMQTSSINGRVLIDSLSFTPDFDLSTFGDQFTANAATLIQPGFADTVRLNVSLQSKQSLSATSSQVSVEGGVDLHVMGTAADPVITGRTELTSGELFYRGNRYQLQRGVITFADPNQTNPNLNVSVASTVEQYNLTINLRGTLDRLTTSYSSDPPLSTTDIIHLIAFGNTTSESAANSASQSTDAMVASSAIGAGLTSGVQKLAGFSSLQIDPLLGGSNQNPSARIALQQRVTKNFLFTFSTDVSQPGEEIVQGDYQISPRWSVNVTRDQVGGVTVAGRLHTKF